MVSILRSSYLNFSPLLMSGGIQFFDTPLFPRLIKDPSDIFLEIDIRTAGRLDLIAYAAYGDEQLWWVIALLNDIREIPSDVKIGKKIRVPTQERVRDYLTQVRG